MKKEYDTITAPGSGHDDELDAILGAVQKQKKTGTANLIDTMDALSDELAEAEDSVDDLKAFDNAKKRLGLKKAPSLAMVDYLIALPPDAAKPKFTTDEGRSLLPLTLTYITSNPTPEHSTLCLTHVTPPHHPPSLPFGLLQPEPLPYP